MCFSKRKKHYIENPGQNSGAVIGTNSGSITIVNQGTSLEEIRPYLQNLVSDEIDRYKLVALEEAKKRDKQLVNSFIKKLEKVRLNAGSAFKAFEDPNMQYDYQEAQKEFIKNGTKELENLLTEILIKRIQEHEGSLMQIVLSESIHIAPKLLSSQMAILALAFIFNHTYSPKVNSKAKFIEYCNNEIVPLLNEASRKNSDFQHLIYTGCARIHPVKSALEEYFIREYKGLFNKGYTPDSYPKNSAGEDLVKKYPFLFGPCYCFPDRKQIQFVDETQLKHYLSIVSIIFKMPDVDKALIEKIFSENLMSTSEVHSKIVEWIPEITKLFDLWNSTQLSMLRVTSVGIVIGSMYSEQLSKSPYDLNNWIN